MFVWFKTVKHTRTHMGGAGGIAARVQIYMGAPIGVVEIHLQLEIAAPVMVHPTPPCSTTAHARTHVQTNINMSPWHSHILSFHAFPYTNWTQTNV